MKSRFFPQVRRLTVRNSPAAALHKRGVARCRRQVTGCASSQSFTHEHPTDRTRIVPNIFRRNPKTDTSTSRKSRKHPQHRQRSDYPQPDKRHEGHAFVIPAYKNSEKPGYTPQDPPIRIEFTHISHPSESRDDPGAENKFSYPPGFGYLCRRQDAVRQFSRTSSHNCSRLSLSL